MKSLNTYEKIGIFGSIILMVLVLGVVRFGDNAKAIFNSSESVTVVENDETALEDALINAHTADGTLVDLVIDDVIVGSGDEVQKGDTVVVHYVGSTQEGNQFDSSHARGEPFSFTVGAGYVIEGWEVGLIGMKEGGKRILVIPSDMAYGNNQVGSIPPNTPLIFAVDLLEIR